MSALFLFLAVMTLGGAVAAMGLRNPVHCALSLVITFLGLAGVYIELGAQFLGLAQVLVYVGAVGILLVFVLLLTRSGERDPLPGVGRGWRLGLLVSALVGGALLAAVMSPGLVARDLPSGLPGVRDLGESLMTDYVVPLQAVGVLLTAALIGAAILALPEKGNGRLPPRSSRR